MAWCWIDDKPLSEPMLTCWPHSLAHICGTGGGDELNYDLTAFELAYWWRKGFPRGTPKTLHDIMTVECLTDSIQSIHWWRNSPLLHFSKLFVLTFQLFYPVNEEALSHSETEYFSCMECSSADGWMVKMSIKINFKLVVWSWKNIETILIIIDLRISLSPARGIGHLSIHLPSINIQ